ncbi:MAG: SEC-C metal-binding domain-containing protein [Gemmatimonadaceae bacterium]
MTTHRNDLCPCGSGLKYKKCCLPTEHPRIGAPHGKGPHFSLGPALRLVRDNPDGSFWEADLVRIAARFEDDPGAQPAVAMVTVGPRPIHVDLIAHAPSDPAGVAIELERAILTAAESTHAHPLKVRVRNESIAQPLAIALAAHDIPVGATDGRLPDLDEIMDGMKQALGITPLGAAVQSPEAWSGWQLPADLTAEIFAAAAAFYRAAPWRYIQDRQVIHATFPENRAWTICVLGNAGRSYGIALYEKPDDLRSFFAAPEDRFGPSLEGITGVVVSLSFDATHNVPRAMRKEVERARWEIAGSRAFPHMFTINGPASGIPADVAHDMMRALRAIPEFVGAHERVLRGEEAAPLPIRWQHEPTHATLIYDGYFAVSAGSSWEVPDSLSTAGPEGFGADPAAALPDDERDDQPLAAGWARFIGQFGVALVRSGLGHATVRKHVRNAGHFLAFLSLQQRIPLPAVTELDLRTFLYEWCPLEMPGRESRAATLSIPGSLRRFFAYLAAHEGIHCPWADPILRDRASFAARCAELPEAVFSSAMTAWLGALTADLNARVMLPRQIDDHDERFLGEQGPVESELAQELARHWLLWRDDLIRGGTTHAETLRAALLPMQKEWERTPHPELRGKRPGAAVQQERGAAT